LHVLDFFPFHAFAPLAICRFANDLIRSADMADGLRFLD
jgi:hypothetical protein